MLVLSCEHDRGYLMFRRSRNLMGFRSASGSGRDAGWRRRFAGLGFRGWPRSARGRACGARVQQAVRQHPLAGLTTRSANGHGREAPVEGGGADTAGSVQVWTGHDNRGAMPDGEDDAIVAVSAKEEVKIVPGMEFRPGGRTYEACRRRGDAMIRTCAQIVTTGRTTTRPLRSSSSSKPRNSTRPSRPFHRGAGALPRFCLTVTSVFDGSAEPKEEHRQAVECYQKVIEFARNERTVSPDRPPPTEPADPPARPASPGLTPLPSRRSWPQAGAEEWSLSLSKCGPTIQPRTVRDRARAPQYS